MHDSTQDDTASPNPTKCPGVFYGWWIVASGTLVWTLQYAVYYTGFSAFFTALTTEFGWSRTALSLLVSLARLQGGIAAPLVGFLIDRVGPRRPMIVGFFLAGAGYILLSQTNTIVVFGLVFVLLLSVGSSLAFSAGATAAVSNWFARRRSLALGIMMSGAGIGSPIIPIIAWTVSQYGWRTAAIACGVLLSVSGVPLGMIMRHRPEPYGYLPDGAHPSASRESKERGRMATGSGSAASAERAIGEATRDESSSEPSFTPKQALATRAFWSFSVISAVRQVMTAGFFVHGIPALEQIGYSREVAATVIAAMTLISISGRLSFGWLGDHLDKRYVIGSCLIMLVIGITALAYATDLSLIIVFLLFFSPAYGGLVILDQTILSDYFGRRSFASISGLTQGVTMWGIILGPVLAGYIFDLTSSYRVAFLVYAGFGLLAILLLLFLRRPKAVPAAEVVPA